MHSVATNGVKLEYEIRGVGKAVALIHLSLCADSFATLMNQPALAGYELIRYHRRGYAGSSRTDGPVSIADQAADLAGLLDGLRVRAAHVVGHSYGGLVALQLALDRPDLVGSLAHGICIAGSLWWSGEPGTEQIHGRGNPELQAGRSCVGG